MIVPAPQDASGATQDIDTTDDVYYRVDPTVTTTITLPVVTDGQRI